MNNASNRNYGLDLLKIVSCFLIVISHVSEMIGYNTISLLDTIHPTKNISTIILCFFRYFGSIGNALFLVCSIWFFIEDNKTSINKVFNIIIDMWFISFLLLIIRFLNGYHYNLIEIITNLMPFYFEKWWYVSCYILLYLIHPYINTLIKEISRKEHKVICLVLIFYYFIMNMFSVRLYGSYLVYFISYYFILFYIKKYMINECENIKLNIILFITSFFALFIVILITNFIGNNFNIIIELEKWNCINNILIFMLGLSLLNIFRNIKIKNATVLTKISSLSLYIYIMHCNELVEYDFILKQAKLFIDVYTGEYIVIFSLALSLLVFIVIILISMLYYKSVRKITLSLSNIIAGILSKKI